MAFTDNTTGGRVIKEGIMPVKITLTDTCEVGDLIGYEGVTDNEWQRADADGKVPAQLVAGEPCRTSGDTIVCFKMAVIDFGSGSTATTGDMVYLSDTVGEYAATPASWVHQCLGECVSATEAFIHPTSSSLFSYSPTGTGLAAFVRFELESGRTGAPGHIGGMRIDCKVVDGATAGGDVHGLYIFMQMQDTDFGYATAGNAYDILRLEDGCSTNCHPYCFINCTAGGEGPACFMFLNPHTPTNGAWATTGTSKTGNDGWLKVITTRGTTYINLHST